MLTVDIEIWPGGDFTRHKLIDRICIANVNMDAEKNTADYLVRSYKLVNGKLIGVDSAAVLNFDRSSGASALLFCAQYELSRPEAVRTKQLQDLQLRVPDINIAFHAVDLDIVSSFEHERRRKRAYKRVSKAFTEAVDGE